MIILPINMIVGKSYVAVRQLYELASAFDMRVTVETEAVNAIDPTVATEVDACLNGMLMSYLLLDVIHFHRHLGSYALYASCCAVPALRRPEEELPIAPPLDYVSSCRSF